MKYNIGIVGPVSGLSDNQHNEISTYLREVLRNVEAVTLHAWRETSTRHPIGSDAEDKMNTDANKLRLLVDPAHVDIQWLDVLCDRVVTLYNLRQCDIVFFCPAGHSTTTKSRVNSLCKLAELNHIRFRISRSWKNETQA